MKINVIYSLLVAFSLLACTKEEALSPSNIDANSYVVIDDPSDELTHLRYTIYQETGVAIFCNDTIYSEPRLDLQGDPYIFYDVIKLGYNFNSLSTSVKYALTKNRDDLKMMIELLNTYTIPLLKPQAKPMCFLVTDSLITLESSRIRELGSYRDNAGTVVGWAGKVKNMTEEQKRRWGAEIAGTEVSNYLTKKDKDSIEIFEKLTTQVAPKINLGSFVSYKQRYEDPQYFGLLHSMLIVQNKTNYYHYGPTKDMDRSAFIGLIYCKTDAEIREMYKDWPKVITKYECMKKLMEKHGFLKTN